MAINDYSSLKQALADWSHRSDLSSYMDDFIKLAEDRLGTDLKVRELETSATGTLSSISLALPSDFGVLRRFTIVDTGKQSPEMIGADGLRTKYDPASGMPKYYAIIGSNIEFNRNPDSAYTYVLDYWKKPPAITSTNTTSDVLTNHPGVYIFACLTELAFFTKNDADAARYQGKYAQYLNMANQNARQQGGPMRVVNG